MKLLKELLYPIDPNSFLNNYWDKKVLHIARDSKSIYKDILSLNQINDLLNCNDINYPMIRLSKNGESLSPNSYTKIKGINNNDLSIEPYQIKHFFYEGFTIVFQYMKYRLKSLEKFCNNFYEETKFDSQTNIYLTPRNSQGFSIHYDAHNVLILQIGGEKHWNIYEEIKKRPFPNEKDYLSDYSNLTPEYTITLKEGDLLYIPRGYGHDAKTTDNFSAHVTTSIFPKLWKDIIANYDLHKNHNLLLKSPILSDYNMFKDDFKTIMKLYLDEITLNQENINVNR